MAARAEVVQSRELWENAMEIVRDSKSEWVHARIVSGKMLILLAQKFRVEAGVVEVLVHHDEAEAGEAENDEAEELGAWVAAPVAARGDDKSEEEEEGKKKKSSKKRAWLRQKGKGKTVKLEEGDKGWQVQLIEGGATGGGKDVFVVRGLWKQHCPIIMGSMGESLYTSTSRSTLFM